MSKPDCHAKPDDPADQPKPPVGEDKCKPIPETCPPGPPEIEPCEMDEYCKCLPGPPDGGSGCLEVLITEKTQALAAAEKDKTFKADLEVLLNKVNAAQQEYTQDKHKELVKQWVEQDEDIADLISKLVCHLTCWRCMIECYVCPFINRIHEAEERLKWDPDNYPKAFNWYDLLEWHKRDLAVKERRFTRIKSVLAAWEKPAQTIARILSDNAKLIADLTKVIGTDTSKVAFDVFFKLVPLHLSIAPPEASGWETKIDRKYTQFCCCDVPSPDDCCGPDVGNIEWSIRQRLVGPQPYLIDPNSYKSLVCCLVKHRYGPAQKQLTDAQGEVLRVEAEIKRDKDAIDNGLKNFDKEARAAIPSVVLCCGEQLDQPKPQQSQAS